MEFKFFYLNSFKLLFYILYDQDSQIEANITLFTLFMSLVSSVANTDDIIQVIFPRWRTLLKNVVRIFNTAYLEKD